MSIPASRLSPPGTPPRASMAVGPAIGSAPNQPVTEFSNGSIKLSLADGPQITFSMPGKSAAALVTDGLATDVWMYRVGVLAERFRVLPLSQEWGESGEDNVSVTAVGYRRVVGARHIISGPPSFTGVDQGQILWSLVQHTQAQTGGDLGITPGTYLTGQLRDRTEYRIGDNLSTIMDEMGDVENGCWWGIDALKVFSARLWSDFPHHPLPIVLGQNARKLNRSPGGTFANAAGSLGSTEQTVPYWTADASVATDPRGRWEAFDSTHSSVILQATVVEYAEGLLAARLHPPALWVCDIDSQSYFEGGSTYAPGDFVTIHVPRSAVSDIGAPPISVNAQVTEVTLGFDENRSTGVSVAAVEVA